MAPRQSTIPQLTAATNHPPSRRDDMGSTRGLEYAGSRLGARLGGGGCQTCLPPAVHVHYALRDVVLMEHRQQDPHLWTGRRKKSSSKRNDKILDGKRDHRDNNHGSGKRAYRRLISSPGIDHDSRAEAVATKDHIWSSARSREALYCDSSPVHAAYMRPGCSRSVEIDPSLA